MKTIDLAENHTSIADLLQAAKQESVVLRSADGDEFFLALIDDFEKEVDSLRKNKKFMEFLDARGQEAETIALEEVKRRLNM